MTILATARHEMGGEFKLAKVSNDFYMYGTQQEFDSLLGVSVDRCGTLEKVLNHCLSIADLCQKHIEKYLVEKSKSKNPNGWQVLIACEQSEKDMLLHFAEVLKKRKYGGINMARIDYDITCFDRVLSVEVSEQDKEKALEIIDLAYFAWCTSESCECCEESILEELTRHCIEFEHIRDYFNETIEQIENDDFESVEDAIDRIQELYKADKITLEQRNDLINLA